MKINFFFFPEKCRGRATWQVTINEPGIQRNRCIFIMEILCVPQKDAFEDESMFAKFKKVPIFACILRIPIGCAF